MFYELEISENSIINSKTITDDLMDLSKSKFGILTEDIATDANAVLTEFERHLKNKYNIEHSAELMAEYIKNSEVIFEKEFDRVCKKETN